jgi:hypothetical protein
VVNLVTGVVLDIMNALIDGWPMVAMNVALAAIILRFLRRLLADRYDEVLEIGPDDA